MCKHFHKETALLTLTYENNFEIFDVRESTIVLSCAIYYGIDMRDLLIA